MIVGLMNNPAWPLEDELSRIAAAGFAFVDLTLEPPGAWPCDPQRIRDLIEELGLGVVGHTAWYLPIASPFPELRTQARELLVAMLDAFAVVGARIVNVHPDKSARLMPYPDVVAANAETIAGLCEEAAKRGLTLMLENLGPPFGRVEELRPILDAAPGARFHLDVGHANLGRERTEPNRTGALLRAFGDRLAHVHVSDNRGDEDLHLPLGAGTIDWPPLARALKQAGWDGTVTIEAFSKQPEQLEVSRRLWLDWWANA